MDFRKVELGDRALIEQYAARYGENSCQYSFPAMYCLSPKYGDSICFRDGWLFILRENLCTEEFRVYLFPLGGGDPTEAIGLLTEDAREHNAKIRFETATEAVRNRLEDCCPGRFFAEEIRDMGEYLYLREKLAGQKGACLSNRRHQRRVFWNEWGAHAEISAVTLSDIPEIRAYQAEWMASKTSSPNWVDLQGENESIETALQHFEELGLKGIVLRIDGKVCGYAFGSFLSPECFDVRDEKCDRGYFGIYTVIKQEMAKFAGDAVYINWEEDVGVPGLRETKLSYHPELLLKKYIVSEVRKSE